METDKPVAEPTGPEREYEVITGLADYATRTLEIIAGARMELALFTHVMDRRIYGSEAFVQAVRSFVLQHRRARLRVLVHSPAVAMKGAHRLVELGRVLSSRIEFRQLLEERRQLNDEYFVGDERCLLYKNAHDDLEARYYAYAPLEARNQLRSFNTLWEESLPAREFTELRL